MSRCDPPLELERRFVRAWHALGANHVAPDLLTRLLACYAEPHRHYHSMQHLRECLALLDRLALQAQSAAQVEMALWFHDAIYDTGRHDNEQRSADWARQSAIDLGVDPGQAQRIADLILVTRHDAVPADADAALLVDIDLAILGAAPARFDEYERQVREEYHQVPDADFRRGRAAILQQFLARETLYSTPECRSWFEAAARDNLRRSIAHLR